MASSPYYLNSGMKCVKYMLLTINFMFILTAVLLILVGTTIHAIFGDFKEFVEDHFLSPPALVVAVGCIMLIVSFFGCYGAIKESTLLINVYGVFLFLMFILEIAAAVAAFLLQGQVHGMLVRTMMTAMQNYNHNEAARKSIDFMQQGLACCGVYDPLDWHGILPQNNSTESGDYVTTVPSSCCAEQTQECNHFEFGCLARMDFLISQSAMLIATGATTVAFVQILGVLCAFMLAKTIRRNKSIRAARRWQMQQNLGIVTSTGKSLSEPGYTQLEKSSERSEPVTYTATSPSVN